VLLAAADLPQCQAVTIAGLSIGVCIPALAAVGALSLTEAQSLFQIESCAGIAPPECDAVCPPPPPLSTQHAYTECMGGSYNTRHTAGADRSLRDCAESMATPV